MIDDPRNVAAAQRDIDFRNELDALINRYSRENGSNTPDFILGRFLRQSLAAFDEATRARDGWYGIELRPPGGA